MLNLLLSLCLTLLQAQPAPSAVQPVEGDFVIRDFKFTSGETLPELRMHYRTLGTPRKDAQGVVRNAVLIMHGTGGTGAQFTGADFAGELFGAGQPLDARRYFIILPDDIGHGRSSKPSDGLRAKFPRYGYVDMVEAQHRLVTEGLGVNHLRLVMGTSMGGMHTWLWGERYPDFMDALMPLASLPTQISGRNRVWRRVVIDAIRNDPEWKNGDYETQPQSLRTAAQMLWLDGQQPGPAPERARRRSPRPTASSTSTSRTIVKTGDANDILYALESSRDYDPGPGPGENQGAARWRSTRPTTRSIRPSCGFWSARSSACRRAGRLCFRWTKAGHGTHTMAALWKAHLVEAAETDREAVKWALGFRLWALARAQSPEPRAQSPEPRARCKRQEQKMGDKSSRDVRKKQRKEAEKIGVPAAPPPHLPVPRSDEPKCCDQVRGRRAWDYLKKRLKELGLSDRAAPSAQGRLPPHLRRRPDRRGLSRGRLVRPVRPPELERIIQDTSSPAKSLTRLTSSPCSPWRRPTAAT